MSHSNTMNEEQTAAQVDSHREPTKYGLGEILHDETGVVSGCCRTTYLLLSRDPWSHIKPPFHGGEQMAWRCVAYHNIPADGVPHMGASVAEMFEEDLDKLARCGFVVIKTKPNEGNT